MTEAFLDSNSLLRHLLGDHPQHSRAATGVITRIERGELRAHVTDTVIFEVVFTLDRSYRRPKASIRDVLVPLLDLPGIVLSEKRRMRDALDLYVDLNIPFADAFHAMVLRDRGLTRIISFDRHFDRISGIVRVEP
ncbi:PIN domain-containing protein [soil metagenome]